MSYTKPPFYIHGELNAVCSKSYLQRAIAIAALAEGQTILKNVTWSEDGLAARQTAEQLGASVSSGKENNGTEEVIIDPGAGWTKKNIELNTGESGLSLRMFAGIAGLSDVPIVITGRGSLLHRPIGPLVQTLQAAGLRVETQSGQLPITICGPYSGGSFEVDGSFSSQMLTGLLLALPLIDSDSEITVHQLRSIPYVDMTIQLARHFGVEIHHDDYRKFRIQGGQRYRGSEYEIEGDWSAAANFLVGAAIHGSIVMTGLRANSLQADAKVIKVLADFGARCTIEENRIQVSSDEHHPFRFDATDCPDLFPPLSVLACAAKGRSVITGTNRLAGKESNRLASIQAMLNELGAHVKSEGNDLIIEGTGKLHGGTVDSFHDHRIAMAAAIAATITQNPVTIQNAEAVEKSNPRFWEDVKTLSHPK